MTENQWGQLVILATTIAGFVVAEYRAARNRRWATEDRERATAEAIAQRKAATEEIIARAAAEAEATRIKTEAIAASLRRHTELTAAQLREEARVGADELVRQAALIAADLQTATARTTEAAAATGEKLAEQIAEVKVEANRAYTEANHINVKIENLNARLLAEERAKKSNGAVASEAAEKKIEKIDATTERIEERQIEQKKGDAGKRKP